MRHILKFKSIYIYNKSVAKKSCMRETTLVKVSKSQKRFMISSNLPKYKTKKFNFTRLIPQVELFSFVSWENWGNHKLLSKFTDLHFAFALCEPFFIFLFSLDFYSIRVTVCSVFKRTIFFLTAILHRGLRNDFFFQFQFTFSILIWTFIFPFLFGLLFPFYFPIRFLFVLLFNCGHILDFF